jgi:hypothetical protein
MNEKQKRSMIIHFNDGSKKLLEFPTPVPDSDANLAARQWRRWTRATWSSRFYLTGIY